MFKTGLLAFTFAAMSAAFAQQTPARTTVPGGLTEIPVGEMEAAMLATVLADDAKYGDGVTTRLCFTSISKLERQIVSGRNDYFHVMGCVVSTGKAGGGKCPNTLQCTAATYVAKVYGSDFVSDYTKVFAIDTEDVPTTPAPQPQPTTAPGGWTTVPVTKADEELLSAALQNAKGYRDDVMLRVCFSEIKSLERSVAAGNNNRFRVSGCAVAVTAVGDGQCVAKCSPAEFSITVYTRAWDSFVQISEILTIAGGSETPRPICPGV